ncbi:nucleoside-triphosphatase [Clostridium estertheticum]|uniref:nucleoside-triphosphatase n=1 Tax=Clostridium estertheticum TaxID=238834 RepID=UPI001C6E00C8|nr:nucleoside-triphosphatase [Clostridium estertheticum]MBW9150735.1 nucleoside-triphosphatase [Clostridium estertheticum]WLC84532.1 nucleoside-triphosphatase [Clostridium estertheticum]
MHIFLTGEIQIGKSTVIVKTLDLINKTPKGFQTYFGLDRGCQNKLLYMNSVSEPKVFREENAVARFSDGYPPNALTEKFDTYGVELIRTARAESNLILMDECGNLEQDAFVFQKEIIDALDDNVPILGVIKLVSRGWTDIIRNHLKVKLILVTRENRDGLPQILVNYFNSNMP